MERFNLVIQTAFIGDLLLTIPLLKHLRQIDSKAQIVLLCRYGFGDFFLHHKLVDRVFEVKKGIRSNWQEVSHQLSQLKFERIISPHQSFRTARLVFKLNAKEKTGFKRFWNFLAFNQRVRWRKDLPEALRLLTLIKDVRPNQDYLKMTNEIPQESSLQLESDVGSREPIVFLAPGSEWATKRWGIEGYTQVAKYFLDKGFAVKVIGTQSEIHLAEIILASAKGCENLCGKTTLSELYDLFRKGKLLISNDSGAMHMAAVAGLPVLAIFGPTVLSLGYRPWTPNALVVQKELSCRPCGLHGSQKCPIGTHECMKGIEPKKVIDAALSFL
ncbi:MAG: glycosyltransferase family 9 protein [Pseudomonadota bacterium]|nr:glycosyltransferase family 9 protein [Pseudomonadota bacterium]